jgi:hypothetical protein
MSEIIKVCKKHGKLDRKDIRVFIYKGYTCKQCLICNREYDRTRYQTSEKRREYEKNRKASPEYTEKRKLYEKNYKDRRRVVNRELYHKKKGDTDYQEKCKKWRNNGYARSKEKMDESYIKKIIKIYKNATPEMIENKRKEILEFRRLRDESKIKKQNKKDLIKKLKEEKEHKKLNGIVKTCSTHGDLTEKQAYLLSNGKKAINRYWFCIQCAHQYRKIQYEKHKDEIRIKHKIYVKNNKEKVLKRQKYWVEKAPDSYVAKYFTKVGIPKESLTAELLDLKRQQLLLKRKVRRMKACQK